jgi:hypothetical protein
MGKKKENRIQTAEGLIVPAVTVAVVAIVAIIAKFVSYARVQLEMLRKKG